MEVRPKMPLCLFFTLTTVLVVAAEWKPGQCPTLNSDQLGICVQECEVDYDCYGNQKCCQNGCGMTCQYPENIGVTHAGLCPVVNSSEPALCVDPPPCEIDQNCRLYEKCCFTGCSFICVAAERLEENRVGICPAEAPSILQQTGPDPVQINCTAQPHCVDDRDCNGGQKCCNDAQCGRTCTRPIYSPTVDKIRILTVCLIVLGGVCLVGSMLSLMKYQHSKRSSSIRNKDKKDAVNMMTHEMEYIDPVPTKI